MDEEGGTGKNQREIEGTAGGERLGESDNKDGIVGLGGGTCRGGLCKKKV